MKRRGFIALAFGSALMASSVSLPAQAATSNQNALKAEAQAEMAAVTLDVDKANVIFSPADNAAGPNFKEVEQAISSAWVSENEN